MCEGFLDVDVLAEAHSVEADYGVRVVGRADGDGVEVLVVLEELAPVHVCGNAGVLTRRAREPGGVDVAERRHCGARLAEFAARHAADAACADNGEAQLPTRQLLPVQHPRGDEESSCGRAQECASSGFSHERFLQKVSHIIP